MGWTKHIIYSIYSNVLYYMLLETWLKSQNTRILRWDFQWITTKRICDVCFLLLFVFFCFGSTVRGYDLRALQLIFFSVWSKASHLRWDWRIHNKLLSSNLTLKTELWSIVWGTNSPTNQTNYCATFLFCSRGGEWFHSCALGSELETTMGTQMKNPIMGNSCVQHIESKIIGTAGTLHTLSCIGWFVRFDYPVNSRNWSSVPGLYFILLYTK